MAHLLIPRAIFLPLTEQFSIKLIIIPLRHSSLDFFQEKFSISDRSSILCIVKKYILILLQNPKRNTLLDTFVTKFVGYYDDLRNIVKKLTSKQVKVKFIKESLEFTGNDSPMSNLLLSVMGAFAEFERNLIKERQMEGIALAKKRGVYRGRSKTLNEEQQRALIKAATQGASKTDLAKEFGINRSTVYEYLKISNIISPK